MYLARATCDNENNAAIPSKRRRKFKAKNDINFAACCPIVNEINIPNELQQIHANETEIQRRVNCFIERKREEINLNNIQNYRDDIRRSRDEPNDTDMSCSRVSSAAFVAKGAKTHLKGKLLDDAAYFSYLYFILLFSFFLNLLILQCIGSKMKLDHRWSIMPVHWKN